VKGKDDESPYLTLLSRIGHGAIGAVAGSVAGVGLPWLFPSIAASLAVVSSITAGIGASRGARALQGRDIVKIEVNNPILVEPYLRKYGKKEAAAHLLEDVQEALVESKKRLMGDMPAGPARNDEKKKVA